MAKRKKKASPAVVHEPEPEPEKAPSKRTKKARASEAAAPEKKLSGTVKMRAGKSTGAIVVMVGDERFEFKANKDGVADVPRRCIAKLIEAGCSVVREDEG